MVAESPKITGREHMATVISQIPAKMRRRELLKLRAKVQAAYKDCPYFKSMLQEVDRELAKEFKLPWHLQGAFLVLYALAAAGSLSFYLYNQVEVKWNSLKRTLS